MRSLLAAITLILSLALQITAAPIAWDYGSTPDSQITREVASLKRHADPVAADLTGLKRSSTDLTGLKERASTDLTGLKRWIVELVQRSTADLTGLKRSSHDLTGLKRSSADLTGLKRSSTDLTGLKRASADLSQA
ncbi:hypothetical protein N0V90_004161 [Kalmusia sp. IMI 367209]|nr:hypothetical protein N0V90_004161 [Kalmusia sp. IMI 367209]